MPQQLGRLTPTRTRSRAVHHQQPQVRRTGPGEGPANALGLDPVVGRAQPGHVGQHHAVAGQHQRRLQHVAGGAGDLGDNGHVAPGQAVQQARLPRIGRADQGDTEPFPHPFAPRIGRRFAHRLGHRRQPRARLRHQAARQFLVWKIDRRLQHGQGVEQTRAPGLVPARQVAPQLRQGLAALGFGLGVHQVGYRFGLGQVQPVVLEGAPGELARFGQA